MLYMSYTDQQKEFLKMIGKYLKGRASREQKDFLKKYYGQFEEKQDVLTQMSAGDREYIGEEIENAIMEEVARNGKAYHWWQLPVTRAAAVVLLLVSAGLYLYLPPGRGDGAAREQADRNGAASLVADIAPGGNKATLELADGRVITLNDAKEGEILADDGISIAKTAEGMLTYTVTADQSIPENQLRFNTVSTPKGGQYRVLLPDGTSVWLNAASSLKYPVAFGAGERRVELTGEGYFEVEEQRLQGGARIPFLVITPTQTVEVLGTHFNINAYRDEPAVKTTLLEGAVRVAGRTGGGGDGVVLQPGEQSVLTGHRRMSVSSVNTDQVVAWKSGLFQFQNSDIESVMRELSRWYDVEVEFEGRIPDIKLWGKVYRNVNASEALKILEYFDLRYRIVQFGTTRKIVIS